MTEKEECGLRFTQDGKSVSIEFNEKMIKKAGKIKVFLDDNGFAQIEMSSWTIAGRKRNWNPFKRKRKQSGILIKDCNSIAFTGEQPEQQSIE